MARNGELITTGGHAGRQLIFNWSTKKVDTANNKTTISWTLKGYGGNSQWYKTWNTVLTIDGLTVYKQGQSAIQLKDGTLVANGETTITHSPAGDREFTVGIEASIYDYTVNTWGSASWWLDDIHKKAELLSAPNFTDEENPTITYKNIYGSRVSKLIGYISFDYNNDLISVDLPKEADSYTFTLTESMRNRIRANAVNSNSIEMTFYVETGFAGDSTRYWSELKRTCTIVNGSVVFNPQWQVVDELSLGLTGNNQTFIRYISDINFQLNAQARKNGYLVDTYATCGGIHVDGQSGTIMDGASDRFYFFASDSRGNYVDKTVFPDLIEYVFPSISIEKQNPTGEGTLKLSANGAVFTGSFGAKENSCHVWYRYKEEGKEFSSWFDMNIDSFANNRFSASIQITGLDYTKAYTIETAMEDAVLYRKSQQITVKATTIFDWSKNDFNINVPLKLNNKTVADFVIEQGEEGWWSWRVWNSGFAELWFEGTVNWSNKQGIGFADFAQTECSLSYPKGIYFTNKPTATASCPWNYIEWVQADGQPRAVNLRKFGNNNSSNMASSKVSVYIAGR